MNASCYIDDHHVTLAAPAIDAATAALRNVRDPSVSLDGLANEAPPEARGFRVTAGLAFPATSMRATATCDAISDVYIARLADVRLLDLERPAAIALRTDAERRRYSRLRHVEARRQFLAARQVARAAAGRALSVPPKAVVLAQRCQRCSSDEHGRPLPERGVWLSWSHSNVAVAVAVSHSAIGVDVEAIGAFGDAPTDIEAMMCTADEAASLPGHPPSRRRALARLWTAKDALVKVGECDLDKTRRTHVGVARPAGRSWQGNQRTWYLTAVESRGVICTAAATAAVRAHTVDAAGLPGWPS